MEIIPITPIDTMFGKVNDRAGYYIRRSPNSKLYSSKCPDRKGHVKTPAEAANQRRLAAISQMINIRKQDPVLAAQDQAAFLKQRNTAGGRTTLRTYLWLVCSLEYDQSHRN